MYPLSGPCFSFSFIFIFFFFSISLSLSISLYSSSIKDTIFSLSFSLLSILIDTLVWVQFCCVRCPPNNSFLFTSCRSQVLVKLLLSVFIIVRQAFASLSFSSGILLWLTSDSWSFSERESQRIQKTFFLSHSKLVSMRVDSRWERKKKKSKERRHSNLWPVSMYNLILDTVDLAAKVHSMSKRNKKKCISSGSRRRRKKEDETRGEHREWYYFIKVTGRGEDQRLKRKTDAPGECDVHGLVYPLAIDDWAIAACKAFNQLINNS